MKLNELTHDEQMVLGGLLRLMLRSDGQFSAGEETTLERIGERIAGGAAPLWSVISQSAQTHRNDADIRASAKSVERGEARRMICSLLEELAVGDTLAEPETQLLSWLRELWA
jgi:hypothetical protein